MTKTDCVFCSIIASPTRPLCYETDTVVAFDDINPKAEVHILIMPKEHIEHVGVATDEQLAVGAELFRAAHAIAKERKLEGFKLAINNGRAIGQSVPHLHMHLLGGQFKANALQSL